MPIPSGDAVTFPAQPGLRAVEQSQAALFARNGEYWTLSYASVRFTVRDVKGLNYIQRLLQHPGEEFHALDLLGASAASAVSGERIEKHESSLPAGVSFRQRLSGDSGEMLDAQAKQEYRRRLVDLDQDMEEFRQKGDIDRADALQSEMDFLKTELSRAVGLGGRDRRAGSAAERARLSVTRAIKVATQKISDHHEALGELLGRCIRTGSFCSYIPAQRVPISWQFSVEGFAAYEGPKPSAADPARTTSLVKRETGLLQSFTHGTTFVGRETEIALLRHSLRQSLRGEGRVVLISGSPGVGKTRIAAEIGKEASNLGALMFVGGCYDREDSVPFIPFVEMLEVALARAPSSEAFRESLGKDAPEIARLLPELRRLFPDIPAPQELPPEQSRRALFNAVSETLVRLSGNGPALLFFDDLHWADESTLSLLIHVARLVSKIPVLVVAAYRDMGVDPGRPLAKALDELIHLQFAQQIHLGGLRKNAVAGMLRALGGRDVPELLANLIYTETEGNPFFVEELFRHLVEQGKLFDSGGGFRLDLNPEEIDVPRSLRLVVGRRLSRLSDEAQKVLATAGIIGRSFTFGLLEASTHVEPEHLLDKLEEAERAGLINSTLEYPDAKFHFSHELTRHAVVDGLSAARRQRLHLDVAETIERLYAETLHDHAEDLAHHLWNAGSTADRVKTLKYLQMAGGKTAQRSANLVAINHFKNALKLAGTIPETPERLEQELMLNTALGTALVATRGFSSLEVGHVFARARELSQRVNETPQLFRVFWGLWVNYAARAQYETGFEMAEQCLRLAQAAGNSGLLLEAHHALAVSCCVAGEFAKGLEHAKQVIAIYNPVDHNGLRFAYGQDPVAACLFHAGSAQWFLGYPDQSAKTTHECIALARRLNHPHTLATATGFGARTYQLSGNLNAVEECAAETVAVASAHDLRFYRAIGVMFGGWALTRRGKIEEGISQLQSGLDAFRATEAVLLLAYFTALLAEVYGEIGQASEGLRILETIDLERDRYWEAELHRLRGELILKQHPDSDRGEHEATAEGCFQRAAAIARKQNAKSLELRAAISMSRLRIRQGKRSEAREELAETFGWFTEGFNTPDLQEAKVLLEGL